MTQLLIGTSNPGKLREYNVLLAHLPVRVIALRAMGLDQLHVDEPFDTYEANAAHKARQYADAARLHTLADDSGVEVDALDGAPGVYSARYAQGGDRDRYEKLLRALDGVPDARRTARFVCVTVLAFPDPSQPPISTRGVIEGRIAHEPTEGGTAGFGYDFVFIPDGQDVAFSALPMDVKNQLSHRGNAIRAMLPHLENLFSTATPD